VKSCDDYRKWAREIELRRGFLSAWKEVKGFLTQVEGNEKFLWTKEIEGRMIF